MLSIVDKLQANHHTYLKRINMPWTWQFRWIQPEKVLEGGAVFYPMKKRISMGCTGVVVDTRP